MAPFTELSPEVISMVIDRLYDKGDLSNISLAHPAFQQASTRLKRLDPATWMRRTIWPEKPFEKASKQAAARLFEFVHTMSPAEANTRFLFEGTRPTYPERVGDTVQNPPERIYKGTLLHLAAYSNLDKIVEFLLDSGADKDLHLCMHFEQWSCWPAHDIEDKFASPIYLAASQGHQAIVDRLSRAGARIEVHSIYWALHHNSLPMLRVMRQSPQFSHSDPGGIIFYAVYNARDKRDRASLVDFLLGHGNHGADNDQDQSYLFNTALTSPMYSTYPVALVFAQAGFVKSIDDLQYLCRCLPQNDTETECLLRILEVLLSQLHISRSGADEILDHRPWRRERSASWEEWDTKMREMIKSYRDSLRD